MSAPTPETPTSPMAGDPQGRWAAYAETPHSLAVARLPEQVFASSRRWHAPVSEGIASLSASRDGRWLAVGHGQGGGVALWAPLDESLSEWREVSRAALPAPAGPVEVAFSPTDDTLAVASGGTLRLLRLDLDELNRLREPGAAPETVPEADGITRLTLQQASSGRWRFSVAGGAGRQDLYLDALAPQDPPEPEELLEMLGLYASGLRVGSQPASVRGWRELRDRLTPRGLPGLGVMSARHEPLLLATPERFAHLPWERLLGDLKSDQGTQRPLLRQPAPRPPQPEPRLAGQALVLELQSGWRSRAERVAARRLLDRLHAELPAAARPSRPSAREAFEALLSGDPAVVVLAGVPEKFGEGLQAGDGALLGVRELQAMRRLPELLLVACGGHPRLAASLGRLGLPACVVPLWSVDEAGASTFCSQLLQALRVGLPLAPAVEQARTEALARHPDSTAWMAYAVWGEPDWQLPPLASRAEVKLDPATDVVRLRGPEGEELIVGAEAAAELVAQPSNSGLLQAIEVLQVKPDPQAPPLAALARAVDQRVSLGLLPLTPAGMADLPARPGAVGAAVGAKLLVLVPGLMGDAGEVFAPLWRSEPSRWARLFERYRGQVYAFQYGTLLDSPAAAAVALMKALPPEVELDLVTHFSAGLVGEIVAQAWSNSLDRKGARPDFLPSSLPKVARERALRMVREVRLGAPMRGTPFGSQRLDMLLALLLMRLPKGQKQHPALAAFNLAAVRQREALVSLPGLAALAGDSPLLPWLASPTQPVGGELRLVAGVARAGFARALLGLALPELSRAGQHDGLVSLDSALAHAPRSRRALARVLDEPGVQSGALLDDPRVTQAVFDALTETRPVGFTPVSAPPTAPR